MLATFTALTAALLWPAQEPRGGQWTWTLYDSDGLTLAHEIPDTDRLSATFECDPGRQVATLTLYQPQEDMAAFARVQSGSVSTTVQSAPASRGSFRLRLRTDHPVMAAFAANGDLAITSGEASHHVQIPQPHRPKLRRFIEQCNG